MSASLSPTPLVPHQTTLAVVAPASAPSDLSLLEKGMSALRDAGFLLKSTRPFHAAESYLAGSDVVRSADINSSFVDAHVQGIICVRGGYGSLRILPAIDYEAARQFPKLVIGYSDITALHLALYAQAGLPGISGPMIGVEWPSLPETYSRQFFNLVGGALCDFSEGLKPVAKGHVEGILLGGNLSVLTRLVGTPYLPSLKGAILFLEDLHEAPYRIDAMLAHLKLAGILDELGGVVLGQFTSKESPQRTPREIEAVLFEYFSNAPFPVAYDLLYGHIPAKWAIPQGIRARLDVTTSNVVFKQLEPVAGKQPVSTS